MRKVVFIASEIRRTLRKSRTKEEMSAKKRKLPKKPQKSPNPNPNVSIGKHRER
jgi:hypothetical protein